MGRIDKGNGTIMNFVASIKSVLPEDYKLPAPIPRAYVGVSIGQKNFRGRRLSAIVAWLDRHTERCRLLIGDELHRHTVAIWNSCSEEEALALSRRAGDAVEQEIQDLLSADPARKFELCRWRSMTSHAMYENLHERVARLVVDDAQFAQSLRQCARQYIDRGCARGQQPVLAFDHAVEVSAAYLTEELAVFAVLNSIGWNVEIYPGPELPVLAEVSHGVHPNVNPLFPKRANIELHLRKVDYAGQISPCALQLSSQP